MGSQCRCGILYTGSDKGFPKWKITTYREAAQKISFVYRGFHGEREEKIMATFEQVERLRNYADISVEEAKNTLDETDEDLLEAVILLEKRGQLYKAEEGGAHTNSGAKDRSNNKNRSNCEQGTRFSELIGRGFRWFGRLVQRGNNNTLKVYRGEETFLSVPVTVLVILLIFAFWIIVPLIVVGLFFDFRYSFHGPDLGRPKVNAVVDKVADAAVNIKKDVKESVRKPDDGVVS
jgi:hypothetical protein